MPLARCAVLVLLVSGLVPVAGVTPIGKVVQMLEELAAKSDADMKSEAIRFAAFSTWCGNTARTRTDEIAAANELMLKLNAKIQKADSRIRALTDRINELAEDVGRWEKDTASASDVRNKEAADYRATAQDYSESIDAVNQAITVLKKQAFDRPQAEAALVQVRGLAKTPIAAKKALAAFLQQGQPDVEAMPDDQLFIKAPEANSYEFQSGGVVDMLEKLKDEFGSKKGELDAEELNAQHAFEQIAQELADNIENAKHEISKKTTGRAQTQELKAEAEGDLAQTTTDRDEDQKYFDDTTSLCAQKSSDFESRTKLREDELKALREAIDIISSSAVAGSGDKHLPALAQGSSFAQLRSSQQSPLQERIAQFLADRAMSCHSQLLSLAAQKVASDPFVKVKKMVKDLISKLMEEGTAETEHKGWCDTELTTNKQTRDAKSEDVATLNADVEGLEAEIAQLTQNIADLTAAVSELDVTVADASAERATSKAKNEQTISDAKDAQTAVEQALAVLKEFYAKSAQATALMQEKHTQPAADAPETFEGPYQGALPEGGNVVDFLEVILSDFVRLESETATAEASEEEQHDTFLFESKKDKALKGNEMDHKRETQTRKESALHSTQAELKATQGELVAAVAYYDKLKPTCVDSGISYEERVRKREEELQSLQEALKILSGTDVDLA